MDLSEADLPHMKDFVEAAKADAEATYKSKAFRPISEHMEAYIKAMAISAAHAAGVFPPNEHVDQPLPEAALEEKQAVQAQYQYVLPSDMAAGLK